MVKEAYRFAIPPLVAGALCLFFDWRWPAGILFFLGLFIFYFFRDPERVIPSESGAVVSPADGHVVVIVEEPLWRGRARSGGASAFFFSTGTHVQRAPVAGCIGSVVYKPGK